ncbi:MAG: TM2 domain-containing protein [Oscillospiraceae bacterium]|nr:TM2 domain-containing protein [Oscillospiraceae bacterium]
MDDESKKVSLRKKGWTDPETGEYYPGGNPNEISQSANDRDTQNSQSGFSGYQSSAFPEFESVYDHSDPESEIYPNQNNSQSNARTSEQNTQNSARNSSQDPDLSIHIEYNDGKKFCKFCGKRIPMDAVICVYCGRQVELLKSESAESSKSEKSPVVNHVTVRTKPRNRWISLILCIIFGTLGVHRFYEGKFKTGLLWLLTGGLFTIGWIVDIVKIASLNKTRYYIDNKGRRKELK